MSSDDAFSSESETDEEWEERLDEVKKEKEFDEGSRYVMHRWGVLNMRSPLRGNPRDYSSFLTQCANPWQEYKDVLEVQKLSESRLAEFREMAEVLAMHYDTTPKSNTVARYIQGVMARLIKYHYNI
jgi:hypothetical protein